MFSPANKATACKMWSPTYIVALVVVLLMVIIGLVFSRKMKEKHVRLVLIIMAIFGISTEIIKMIFVGVTYGIEKVEFLPLYFCSLFMYSTVLAATKVKVLKNTGLSFLFFGGIIGATAFFIYPSACIPNYPIYHFMCLRTMLFHGSMIYAGILIVITGFYKPKLKHFLNYFVALIIVCLLAYIINLTTGSDLMYLSKPLDFEISKVVYNKVPNLYPFIVMILEITVPFFTSYLIYYLISLIITKINFKRSQNV